ncbi:hypothetical protein BUALT_Bualt03G0035100 [Buddleja alternifolia]|uniref:Bromo domain-containing protein n=1 Tax=Buddleja alternifolia TaxID=168488 RepID=A0AAV6XQV1_9LAMI|nr:hypothetical protein BUALT_Bualt03G0035100 [Buddleja alternifolia]
MVMVAESQAINVTHSPFQHLKFPTMSAVVPGSKKLKITIKGLGFDSEEKSQKNNGKVIVKNGQRDSSATDGRDEHSGVKVSVKPSMPANSSKRRTEMSLDGQRAKKRKMDHNLKLHCASILNELMKSPVGWVFNEPVDPVKLQIPDYFSIITKPMDLGTIKRKLEDNMYIGAEGFAADVRLTFHNAMLYNPPGNEVHNWAKKLEGNFSRRWKSVETKLKGENKTVKQASFMDDMGRSGQYVKQTVENNCQDTKPVGHNKVALRVKVDTCRSMSSEKKNHQDTKPIGLNKAQGRVKPGSCRPMSLEEKQKFKLELVRASSGKMMENLRFLSQKFGLTCLNEERLDSYLDSTDDGTLWKLRREIKFFLDARNGKAEPARRLQDGCSLLGKTIQKEHCGPSACAFVNLRRSHDSTASKCCSCGSLTCHCHLKNGSAQASLSDLSSERSSEHDHCGDSEPGEVKNSLAFHTMSSCVDSDGPGIVVNEGNSPHLSTPAATAASGEGWTSINVQMSPKKALRAAMLKSRFADTIFKATHQAILDHGDKSDPARMQQEIERLEREQLAEKARIESEIKAAEAAAQRKAQDDLKMRREREREAARMALQKMEKTVEIDQNLDILKDLEMLCCSPTGEGFGPGSPLERLGLYMKDDYLEEDEDAVLSGEEGEIIS